MGNNPNNKKDSPKSICIVTNDFCIEKPRGGVGTFHYALANFLSENEYDVTVLLLTPERYQDKQNKIKQPKDNQFKIISPPKLSNLNKASWSRRASYEVYSWFKKNHFDWIHFHEWLGLGFYTLQAKKTGLEFQKTKICVGAHGPHEWILECNEQHVSNSDLFEIIFMEKKSIEMADSVWSPSKYMINWLKSNEYKLPNENVVLPILTPNYSKISQRKNSTDEISKIVFFGRIEHRKGIKLICDAYEKIIEDNKFCNLNLFFIGPEGPVDSIPGYNYICKRSKNWKLLPKIIPEMSHENLMEFISDSSCAAILPSLVDNSPLTVHECIQYKIPCITTATGGIPEFVEENKDALISKTCANSLSIAIKKIQSNPNSFILKYKNSPSKAEEKWLQFHSNFVNKKKNNTKQLSISVCITHHERPNQLKRAIDSVLLQSKEAMEIIIVDDGSKTDLARDTLKEIEETNFKIPVKIIRQKNSFVGAARNESVKYASGEYIVFLDDDNVMEQNALASLQSTLINTDADIVTSSYKSFKNTPKNENCVDIYLPLGSCIETGLLWNCFGDTFSIQSKELFVRQGGFLQNSTKFEDWEYLARIALNNLKIEIVPEALCWNELSIPSISTNSPDFQNLNLSSKPFLKNIPKWAKNILRSTRGAYYEKSKHAESMNDFDLHYNYIVHSDIFFSLNKKSFQLLEGVHDTKIEFIDNILFVNSASNDPALLSPELPFPNSGTAIILIEIEVPNKCEFNIYYQKSDKPNYTETQSIKKQLNKGENKFLVKVSDSELAGKLRIDPGEYKGIYKIHSFEIRLKI